MSTAWSSVSRPRLVQEAHQREATAWSRHPAHPSADRGSHAVEQDPLVVAVGPSPRRLPARRSPRSVPAAPAAASCPDRRVRRARLDSVQEPVRLVVVNGDQRIKISRPISTRVCWGNRPSTRTKATWYGRVDDWRGDGRRRGVAVPGGSRRCRCLNPRRGSVSSRRSSVGSRAGAPPVGSGGSSGTFAPSLSPAPLSTFQLPPRQTQHADFQHWAFLLPSSQGLVS